jgi:hypothetical protein
MPRNGSGTYQLPSTSFNPAVSGTDIESAAWNTTGADLAAALSGSIAKDGQTTPTANLPMGGFKHTGVANGTARTQYPSIAQIQDGTLIYAAATGSSTTSYTATLSPAVTAYVDGAEYSFKADVGNASACTLAINSASSLSIRKNYDDALVSGDIVAGQIVVVRFDSTNNRFQMVSPSAASVTGGNGISALTASANTVTGFNGSSVAAKFPATAFARTVWDDATAASARSTMAAAIKGAVEGINTQTGLTYTLALTDAGKIVEMNRASANTVTIPPNATIAFDVNAVVDIVQYGAGQTTIAAGSGVTVRSAAGLKIAAQYGGVSAYKRGTNEWVVVGRTTT